MNLSYRQIVLRSALAAIMTVLSWTPRWVLAVPGSNTGPTAVNAIEERLRLITNSVFFNPTGILAAGGENLLEVENNAKIGRDVIRSWFPESGSLSSTWFSPDEMAQFKQIEAKLANGEKLGPKEAKLMGQLMQRVELYQAVSRTSVYDSQTAKISEVILKLEEFYKNARAEGESFRQLVNRIGDEAYAKAAKHWEQTGPALDKERAKQEAMRARRARSAPQPQVSGHVLTVLNANNAVGKSYFNPNGILGVFSDPAAPMTPGQMKMALEEGHNRIKGWFSQSVGRLNWISSAEIKSIKNFVLGISQGASAASTEDLRIWREFTQRLYIYEVVTQDMELSKSSDIDKQIRDLIRFYSNGMSGGQRAGFVEQVLAYSNQAVTQVEQQIERSQLQPLDKMQVKETFKERIVRIYKDYKQKIPEIVGTRVVRTLGKRLAVIADTDQGVKIRAEVYELTPEEIRENKPSKIQNDLLQGKTVRLSVQAMTFMAAIAMTGQISTVLDYASNPVAKEQMLAEALSPATIGSLLTFLYVQNQVGSRIDQRKINKLNQLAAQNPVAFELEQHRNNKFGRKLMSGMGLTALSVGLVAGGLVYDLGKGLESCKLAYSYAPMPMRDREKHKATCDNYWEQWNSGELFYKYGPMLLSAMAVGVVANIIQAGIVGGARVVGKGAEKLGQVKLGSLRTSTVMPGETPLNTTAKSGTAVIEPMKIPPPGPELATVAKAGGRVRLLGVALQMMGAHPVTRLIVQTGVATLVIEGLGAAYTWVSDKVINTARIGNRLVEAEQLLRQDLELLRTERGNQLLVEHCDENGECATVNQITEHIQGFAEKQRGWRQQLMSKVYSAYNNWIDYVYTAANRFKSAEMFYFDVVDQVAQQRKKGFAYNPNQSEYHWFAKNMYQDLPLFRSNPLYGVAVEEYVPFLNKLDIKVLETALKEVQAQAEKEKQEYLNTLIGGLYAGPMRIQQIANPSRGSQFGDPNRRRLDSSQVRAVGEEKISQKLKKLREVRDWLNYEIQTGHVHFPFRKSAETILKALGSNSYIEIMQAIELANREAVRFDMTCAGLTYMDKSILKQNSSQSMQSAEAFARAPRNASCLFHEILNQLKPNGMGSAANWPRFMLVQSIREDQDVRRLDIHPDLYNRAQEIRPLVLGPGVKFLSEYDNKIALAGLDGWTFPESIGFGLNVNMSQYLLTAMVCGPDVDKGEKLFQDNSGFLSSAVSFVTGSSSSRGYRGDWLAPRIVNSQLEYYCKEMRAAGLHIADRLLNQMPSLSSQKRVVYNNIVDLLFNEMRSFTIEGFKAWWDNKVVSEFQKFLDDADEIYQRDVIGDEYLEVLNEKGPYKGSATTFISNGIELKAGVIESYYQEMDYYFNGILQTVMNNAIAKGGINSSVVKSINEAKSGVFAVLGSTVPGSRKDMEAAGQQLVVFAEKVVAVSEGLSQIQNLSDVEVEAINTTLEKIIELSQEIAVYYQIIGAIK